MTVDAAFWDEFAESYARDPLRDMRYCAYTLERTSSFFKMHSSVLEIVCGTGMSVLLQACSAGRILACDISKGMIQIAREKLRELYAPQNARFDFAPLSGDCRPLCTFDVVTAFNVLHLDQAFAALAERVRPRGWFISKTAYLGGSDFFLLMPLVAATEFMGKAAHVVFPTRKTFWVRTRAHGFQIIKVCEFRRRLPRRFIAARCLD